MSCYFRHMKDILEAAGVVVTKENKTQIDRIIHNLVNVEYKNCPTTWKAVKERIRGDEEAIHHHGQGRAEIIDIAKLSFLWCSS
jgi:tRNA G37 N-methylase Trm5